MSVSVKSMFNPWLNISITHQRSIYKIAIPETLVNLTKSELITGRAWRMVVFLVPLHDSLVDPGMGTTALGDINDWEGVFSVHSCQFYSYFLALLIPLYQVTPHHKLWPMDYRGKHVGHF